MRLGLALVAFAMCGIIALAADTSQVTSPACEAVTRTVTVFASESSGAVASAMPTAASSYSTITSFSTLTSYVTVPPPVTSSSVESIAVSSTSSAYYYVDNNGTTSWLNGVSPAATYGSYVTKTIEITVQSTTDAVSEVTVVQTRTLTVTPTAATVVEPLVTSTVTAYLTSSLTATSTVFLTTSSSSPAGLTFSVPSITGWNASSTHSSDLSGTAGAAIISSGSVGDVSKCSVSVVHLTINTTYTVEYASTAIDKTIEQPSSVAAAATGAVPVLRGASYGPSGSKPISTANSVSSDLISSATAGAVSQTMDTTTALSSAASSFAGLPLAGYNASVALAHSLRSAPLASASTNFPQYPSSTLSKVFSNTTSSTAVTPSVCGEHGDFTLTWDDEPNFVPTNPITDPSDAPPVFNPYHHMYFSSGYIYMPPPSSPYPPASLPRLVMFLTNETGNTGSVNAGGELSGEIGAGVHRSSNAFWFNAYSAYLGCDNGGSRDCTMHITGLVYQQGTNSEVAAFQQDLILAPCPGLKNCNLQKFTFAKSMRGLSGIRIEAFVGGQRRPWYMDDLALGWYNNTCAAGLLRLRSR